MKPVEIRPLAGRADREAFIRLPGRIMAGDPAWVEPLRAERRAALDPRRTPLLRRIEAEFWLARRDGRPVGRISAQLDPLAPRDAEGRPIGQFGMLAAERDPALVRALLDTAAGWLARRGAACARGPFSLSINQESGVLVEGFEQRPFMLTAQDPPWLGGMIEAAGWRKARDLIGARLDFSAGALPERGRRMAEKSAGPGLAIRSMDYRRYAGEIRTVTDIFNDAWAGNWGFTPLDAAEVDAMAKALKPILDPELVKIAELDGAPVGFLVALPDVNEAIADLGGRLAPFGWARLLWRLRRGRFRGARVALMGVRRSVADSLIGRALPLKLIYAIEARTAARGFREIEMSWLLEDNLPIRRIVAAIGGRETRRWRVYEKRLE